MNSRQLAQKWPFPRHKPFEKKLRIAASNWFRNKNFNTHPRMPYCLSEWDEWKKNIILDEVSMYIETYKNNCEKNSNPFPLHKYIHHGLSSQAMAFNLIGPLITRNDLSPLLVALQKKNIQISSQIKTASFEYEDRTVFNEDSGQPTSIDIVLKNENEEPVVFIESKLVEKEFGGCSVFSAGDCSGKNPIQEKKQCYLHFIGRKYWELVEKYEISTAIRNEQQCIFVAHYQYFREVLLSLAKGGIFVLLSDARSPVFHCEINGENKGLMPFLLEFVPNKYKNRIASISIQELVETIKNSKHHQDWISDFEIKYGIS